MLQYAKIFMLFKDAALSKKITSTFRPAITSRIWLQLIFLKRKF
jgi:hypothetical protein